MSYRQKDQQKRIYTYTRVHICVHTHMCTHTESYFYTSNKPVETELKHTVLVTAAGQEEETRAADLTEYMQHPCTEIYKTLMTDDKNYLNKL